MRRFTVVLLAFMVQLVSSGLIWAADAPVFGTFALFEVDSDWRNLSVSERQQGGQDTMTLLETFKDQVSVDAYWTYGLTNDSHFLLRLHSNDLQHNQQFLTQFQRTGLGRYVDLDYTISGVTKGLNYAPEFPDLLKELKAAKYEGEPPRYAIMIPIRKNAEWWNLPKEDRVAMMREHTVPTLAYLKTIKRKLYHSTGLSDVDFLTIFETNNLVDFNDLVIALRMVREDTFNVQLGEPTIIGTNTSWKDLLDFLVK